MVTKSIFAINVALIIAKLLNLVDWSWWLVMSPTILVLSVAFLIGLAMAVNDVIEAIRN